LYLHFITFSSRVVSSYISPESFQSIDMISLSVAILLLSVVHQSMKNPFEAIPVYALQVSEHTMDPGENCWVMRGCSIVDSTSPPLRPMLFHYDRGFQKQLFLGTSPSFCPFFSDGFRLFFH
jgi:hypothetical protein